MLDQIEQLIGGVRNVSNAIAHDLRTPLAELRARFETLLLDRHVSGHIADEIEGAIDDTDRLITTFNALLRLAELDSGAKRSGFTKVDASTIIAKTVELYAPVAETKSVALLFENAGSLDLDGDAAMIAQAVANLLDNALKYAPSGTDVTVTADRHTDGTVALAVSDHGPGIPAGERPRVTERFFRGTGSAGTSGVGLGLSMVVAIARLHGGRLELDDNHPGLRATLLLPSRPSSRNISTSAGRRQLSELPRIRRTSRLK
jgi:signal transduction histidine kinase